jgi:hypothetical protein
MSGAAQTEGLLIDVSLLKDADPLEFTVVIRDGDGETRHAVTMARSLHHKLTGGSQTPIACVEAAFCFLLDREPKESILARFDISVISRYFPEFERELPRYLEGLEP